MNLIKLGVIILLCGILLASFSDLIAEEVFGFERSFGEEPLSMKFFRSGLLATLVGIVLMLVGAVRNKRLKRNKA